MHTNTNIGKKFGKLVLISLEPADKNRHVKYKCKCECGRKTTALWQNIRSGKTKSCGCLRIEAIKKSMRYKLALLRTQEKHRQQRAIYRKTLIGKKFGRITIKNISTIAHPNGQTKETAECVCECGKPVVTQLWNVLHKHTNSCGCSRIYRHPVRNVGLRHLYALYKHRSKRYNSGNFSLSLERFRELTSSNCFYCGRKPETVSKSKSSHSEYLYNGLDRVDSSKGYVEENIVPCCWACNKMKLDHNQTEFKNHIIAIHNHWIQNGHVL